MNLNDTAKKAVRELGEAINAAVEKSSRVAEAIENLRQLGYEPNLMLKLEIGLQEITDDAEDFPEDFERTLTYSSHISFNSLSQFNHYYPQVQRFTQREISCGLRVNPEFSVVETDLYNPGKAGGRLGAAIENLPSELPNGIDGLHVHALCESSATETEGLLLAIEQK